MKKTEIIKTNQDSFNIQLLVEKAVENKVDVGTMEKLLSMRNQLKKEWAREEFYRKMSELQAEMPVLKKTNIVKNKDGSVRYKYTPLDEIITQVKGLIKKHGFSYIIDAEVKEGWVKAICKVVHQSGHEETSTFEVPIDKEGFMNQPQKFASALTFAKRYAFCNAFGILTADEDDDTAKTHDVEIQQNCKHERTMEAVAKQGQNQGRKYKFCVNCKKFISWVNENEK